MLPLQPSASLFRHMRLNGESDSHRRWLGSTVSQRRCSCTWKKNLLRTTKLTVQFHSLTPKAGRCFLFLPPQSQLHSIRSDPQADRWMHRHLAQKPLEYYLVSRELGWCIRLSIFKAWEKGSGYILCIKFEVLLTTVTNKEESGIRK